MRIAVDVCHVLADFSHSFAKLMNSIQSRPVDIYDPSFPVCWQWFEHYGWSDETIQKAWTEVKFSGSFWKFLHPLPNAYEDLKFLNAIQKYHDIYFVTNRPGPTAKQETEEWIAGRGYLNPTVVISGKKELFCQAADIDIIIDDSVDNLLKIKSGTKTILFKQPHNKAHWGYFGGTVNTIREALCSVV